MSIFFTSDNHFYHKNILKYQPDDRPFDSVDEMNEAIIEAHNSVVGKKDHVYFLGDFSFTNINNTIEILKRLNGIKYLIYGNHDRIMKTDPIEPFFEWRKQYFELNMKQFGHKEIAPIVLFHFSIEKWNRKHYGSYHLHGHEHCSGKKVFNRLDVGVDGHNLTPWSLNEVIRYFDDQTQFL